MALLLIAVAAALLGGCSARQVYAGIQQGKRNACEVLPQSQQARCLEQANISYEEYERRRRAAQASP